MSGSYSAANASLCIRAVGPLRTGCCLSSHCAAASCPDWAASLGPLECRPPAPPAPPPGLVYQTYTFEDADPNLGAWYTSATTYASAVATSWSFTYSSYSASLNPSTQYQWERVNDRSEGSSGFASGSTGPTGGDRTSVSGHCLGAYEAASAWKPDACTGASRRLHEARLLRAAPIIECSRKWGP